MRLCKLCKKEAVLQKHHIIPKIVINQVKPKSDLINKFIYICEDCHQKIHFSFMTHILMHFEKNGGINNIQALKFLIIREFLKEKHIELYSEWKQYYKDWICNEFKKIDEEEGNDKVF